jgi:AcrR family transcriptional regulator
MAGTMVSTTNAQPMCETAGKIIEAAENLLIVSGFSGMSARAVAKAAKVNIAAMRYYFGSKQGLFEAVVRQRIAPVNAERLARLAVAETERPGSVDAVLDAFLLPVFAVQSEENVRLLMARVMAEPAEIAGPLLSNLFQEVIEAFVEALHECRPEHSRDAIARRLSFVVGAMSFSLLNAKPRRFKTALDDRSFYEELRAFCAGGFELAPKGP